MDSKINILVSLDASQVAAGAAASAGAVTAMERNISASLQRLRTGFGALSTGQKTFAGVAVAAGLVGTAIAATVGPAIQFESAFAGVRKTVDGTPAQLAGIRDGLLDMSRVMPTSASELAAIAENAGQLGVQAPRVLEFTQTIAQLGETTDLDFENASQSLARFLNVTGNDAPVARIADVIVELGNNSATTESQIVNFSTRMASAFTVAGAREDQILALASSFSSLGLEAEAGGSALSRIITSISDAAANGGDELEVYASTAGLLPEQFAKIAEENPVEALVLFGEGLGRLQSSGESITPVLESLSLGGIRTSEVFRNLALNSDFVRSQLDLAAGQFENGGAAAEEYGKRVETTAARLEIFRNRLTAVAIAVGSPLLDVFAASVDLAGDAVERLDVLLGPLGSEIGEAFGNAAQVAGAFYDVLGGPALQVAVAGFTGLVAVATGILNLFNSLGPAGSVAAAGVLLVATNTQTAAAAFVAAALNVQAFGISIQTVGARAALTTAAMAGLNAVLVASPYVAIVVALASLGSALTNAATQATAAGTAVREDLNAAIQSADFSAIEQEIGDVTARMAELREIDQVPDGVPTSWRGWGDSIKSVAQVLTPFTENSVVNARAEMAELQGVVDEFALGNFANDIQLVAGSMGISESATIALAQELGVLEQLTQGTIAEFFLAAAAIEAYYESVSAAGSVSAEFIEQVATGIPSLSQYASELGLTASQLETLAANVEGVELADLVSEDAGARLAAYSQLAASLGTTFAELASQVGLSTGELLDQIGAVDELAASHSRLQQAVNEAQNALALLDSQQRNTAAAADEFNAALTRIGENGGIETAGQALQTYLLNFAASGVTVAQFEAEQRSATAAIVEAASAAGATQQEIVALVTEYAAIPPSIVTELIAEGASAEEATRRVKEIQDEVAREILIEMGIIDGASEPLARVRSEAEEFGRLAPTATLSVTDNATPITSRVRSELEEFARFTANATLTATDQASPVTKGALTGAVVFSNGDYNAFLRATDQASGIVNNVSNVARSYSSGDYTGQIRATDAGASSTINVLQGVARSYASGNYTGQIRAADAGASGQISRVQGSARSYASGNYTAVLRAIDQASGVIGRAVGALSAFRSKTVTIQTNYRTTGSGFTRSFADGGITAFASGGLSGTVERPGNAKIYSAATPYRIFAEPETGGEAYIPLAPGKRSRATAIWAETGRLIGAMANGGIQSTPGFKPRASGPGGPVVIESPINVSVVASPGMDEQRVAEIATNQIDSSLRALGRELANQR